MATKFGRIQTTETSFEEQIFYKNQRITSASIGVQHHFGLKDDQSNKPDPTDSVLTKSGSQWAFVHNMFYMSGSSKVNTDEQDKFNSIYHNFNQHNDLKPFHSNKFYDTASIFYIPQQYFGERVKPGTFQLTARTGSSSNTTKQILIQDDSNGNLFAANSYHPTASSFTSLSSSANYIGNIYYDLGVAVLTDTSASKSSGIWSGSMDNSQGVLQAMSNGGYIGDAFTIKSAQGTEVTYTAAAAEDLAANEFKACRTLAGSNINSIGDSWTSLKDCIDHASGHNGELVTIVFSTQLHIQQTMDGAVGNYPNSYISLEKGSTVSKNDGSNRYAINSNFNGGGWVDNDANIRYTDIGNNISHTTRDYRFWDLRFNTTTPIFTTQYSIKIPAGEFNTSMNNSVRIPLSGSLPSGSNVADYANLRSELTGSDWSPYFNQIQLYRKTWEQPVMIANLPRNVKMRDDVDIIITFRVDH